MMGAWIYTENGKKKEIIGRRKGASSVTLDASDPAKRLVRLIKTKGLNIAFSTTKVTGR